MYGETRDKEWWRVNENYRILCALNSFWIEFYFGRMNREKKKKKSTPPPTTTDFFPLPSTFSRVSYLIFSRENEKIKLHIILMRVRVCVHICVSIAVSNIHTRQLQMILEFHKVLRLLSLFMLFLLLLSR